MSSDIELEGGYTVCSSAVEDRSKVRSKPEVSRLKQTGRLKGGVVRNGHRAECIKFVGARLSVGLPDLSASSELIMRRCLIPTYHNLTANARSNQQMYQVSWTGLKMASKELSANLVAEKSKTASCSQRQNAVSLEIPPLEYVYL